MDTSTVQGDASRAGRSVFLIYFDSETCGLTGPMILLQYAKDDGPIHLHEIWTTPIPRTLEVIEELAYHDEGVVGFNLSFDWFHVNKIYNCLRMLYDNGYKGVPQIEAMSIVEASNPSEYCLRPQRALDLMLVARKSKYQYVMNRKPITVRRVPRIAAEELAEVLKSSIDLPDICFAKDPKGYRWRIKDREDPKTGRIDPDLVDVQLGFRGSTSLGALASDILGEPKADWPIDKNILPTELDYWPYGQHGDKPWALVISSHMAQWHHIPEARYYAERDVYLTRRLHLEGFPEWQPGDIDSELACAVGAVRWRGFEINHERATELHEEYGQKRKIAPRSPKLVMQVLKKLLPPVELLVVKNTKKQTLEAIVKNTSSEEARDFCKRVLEARQCQYRHTLLGRLKELPRFHPDFKVIGTKSNRQSGGSEEKGSEGSINAQGIPRDKAIRSCITFKREGEELHGGDAHSFEITIIDAVLPDANLHEALKSGKSFHALMGEIWYNVKYEDMMFEKETGGEKYDKSKAADFAASYGAMERKLSEVLGIEIPEVEAAMERWAARFPEMYARREEIAMRFCSMRQPGGLGTKVYWHEPDEYIESIFGFRRYFTMENEICRALFRLANKPPASLRNNDKFKDQGVVRNPDRGRQTILGAVSSALYATAFGLQAANMRAACNHIIQSPGGEICKEFQYAVWNEQPRGVAEWKARTYNMHDELLVVTDGSVDTLSIRDRVVEKFRRHIPLLSWEWKTDMESWADK
jgi:hypothetical protein